MSRQRYREGLLVLLALLVLPACGPKRKTVSVPVGYSAARSATLSDLLDRINQVYAGVETLSVSRFQVKFTGGSVETGYLKEYPSAKGHLVAKRPRWIYVNILNPVTSSPVVTMASDSSEFQIWVPRENKYVIGKTDVRTNSSEPLHSVRPEHLLQAILIEPVEPGRSGLLYLLEEQQDESNKYYVVQEIATGELPGQGCLRRKLWLERRYFGLTRQEYFSCGELVSDIRYEGLDRPGDQAVPSAVSVRRLPEHYEISFRFQPESVRLNKEIDTEAFQIPKPAKAELVIVEDERSNDNGS